MPVDQETLEKRRKTKLVLKQLRQHQQEVEDDKDNAVDCRSDALHAHFQQASKNIEKCTTVDQALVDAQTFRKLGEYTQNQANQLQSTIHALSVKSFIDCLVENINTAGASGTGSENSEFAIDFVKLGQSVAKHYRTIPSLDFMFGNEPKEEAAFPIERKSRQVKKGKNAVKPSELRTEDIEQTETDKQVAIMKKELENRRQCNFWLFVIDPNDFSRSVENIFHSSFLIKDSWAQLDLKSDPPMIKYQNPEENDPGYANGSDSPDRVSNSEYILELDHVIWKEMIEKYDIRHCILPRNKNNRNDARFRQMLQYNSETLEAAPF